jgi:DHA1 family multidrug resistance protein-like MFS transporter
MLVRAVGFAAMAFAGTYAILMGAAIVSAVGGALFESPRSAAVAALTDESERSSYFAKTGVAGGLGITAGTQLGALLLGVDFRLVALVSAAMYVLIFVVILLWLPAVQVAEKGGPFRGLKLAFRDRPFLTYTGFMGGHQFMAAQFSITLPLVATAIAGNPSAVAWVYAVNSVIAVVLGYPMPRLAERRIGARRALIGTRSACSSPWSSIRWVSSWRGRANRPWQPGWRTRSRWDRISASPPWRSPLAVDSVATPEASSTTWAEVRGFPRCPGSSSPRSA